MLGKVVHKENGGPASARKAGLALARGQYTGFANNSLRYIQELLLLLNNPYMQASPLVNFVVLPIKDLLVRERQAWHWLGGNIQVL